MISLGAHHRDWRRPRGIKWMIVTVLCCSGCLKTASTPRPIEPAEQAAHDAVISYARGLADSFDDAAAKLHGGSLSSAAESNQHLQSANAATRQQAFHQLDELLNDELGGDKWDADHAQRLFGGISQGLRSVR